MILLIAVLNGVTKMSGVGKCPETDVLEGLAEKAFKQVCERVDVGFFFLLADGCPPLIAARVGACF